MLIGSLEFLAGEVDDRRVAVPTVQPNTNFASVVNI